MHYLGGRCKRERYKNDVKSVHFHCIAKNVHYLGGRCERNRLITMQKICFF